MATAPKTLSRRKGKRRENRGSAYKRGYDRWWQHARMGYLTGIIHETGDLICGICGKSMLALDDVDKTVDHIIPPSSAGPERSPAYMQLQRDPKNWRPACRSCNSAKQARFFS